MDDPVVFIAEVIDSEPLGRRNVGHGHGFDGEDEGVLVEDLVVFDVRAQRQRGRGLAAVEEDAGAGHPLQRGFHGVKLVDERRQRPFIMQALTGNESDPDLPQHLHGTIDKAEYLRLRDEYMLGRLVCALGAHDRVFATVGVSHAVMLEPALLTAVSE